MLIGELGSSSQQLTETPVLTLSCRAGWTAQPASGIQRTASRMFFVTLRIFVRDSVATEHQKDFQFIFFTIFDMTQNYFFLRVFIDVEDALKLDFSLIWTQTAAVNLLHPVSYLLILETSVYLRALGHVEVRVKRFWEKTECGDVFVVYWLLNHVNSVRMWKNYHHGNQNH